MSPFGPNRKSFSSKDIAHSQWGEVLPQVFLTKYKMHIKRVFKRGSGNGAVHVVEFHSLPNNLLGTGLAREKEKFAVLQRRPLTRDKIYQRSKSIGEIQRELHGLTPHILPEVYDLLYADKSEYILMQYFPYELLSNVGLNKRRMVPIVRQLKAALDIWHKNDWYHCDFGLSNILVKVEGRVWKDYTPYIIDFGEIRDCRGDSITEWNDFMELYKSIGKAYGPRDAEDIWNAATR